MGDITLKCEVCGRNHREIPIIQKPLRFCYETNIHDLPQINRDGRSQDNICLPCLEEEVDVLRENY